MAKHASVEIIQNKGQSIPDDFLTLVADKFKGNIGISAIHEDGTHIVSAKKKPSLPMADLRTLVDRFKTTTAFIHVGTNPDVLDDDIQPYTILEDADGKALLVAFLDGDFSTFDKTGSARSGAGFCVDEEIKPRVQKLFGFMNGDMKKLDAELADPHFVDDLCNFMVGDRGSITFFSHTGDVRHILVATDDAKTFDWGWVSNPLGYKPKAANAIDDMMSQMETKPRGKHNLPTPPKAQVAAPVAADPARPAPTTVPKPVPGAGEQPDVVEEEEKLSLTVPHNLHHDTTKLSRWLKKRIVGGMLPERWPSIKTLIVSRENATKVFLEDWNKANGNKGFDALKTKPVATAQPIVPKTATAVAAPPPAAPKHNMPPMPGKVRNEQGYPARASDEPQKKDDTPHHIGNETPSVVNEPMPIIPPSDKAEFLAHYAKPEIKESIDRHAQLIMDPAKYEEFEKKIPSLVQQLPTALKSLDDLSSWHYEFIMNLCMGSPKVAAVVIFNLIVDRMKSNALLNELTTPHTGKTLDTTGNEVNAEADVHVEPAPAGKKHNLPPMPRARKAAA